MSQKFQSILITGASSGIGAALAKHYAKPDVKLFLIGRNQERLQEVKNYCLGTNSKVYLASINVTSRKNMKEQIIAWDTEHSIDLVIANAGISNQKGEETQEEVENTLSININGVVNTIYPLIPKMKARKSGTIAIVSSLAGFRGMPTAVSYSASKNAVRAMGDALRPELKIYRVNMTVICPGFIQTPLTDKNPFPMPFLMTPEKSAKIIAKGIEKNKKRIAFPYIMYVLSLFMAFLPISLTDYLLVKASKKEKK